MNAQFDPQKHHRRSIRRRGWDYRLAGAYFITICTYERAHILDNEPFRDVAANAWQAIPTHGHAQHVHLDEWIVMPNHIHGIIIIDTDPDVGARQVGTNAETQNQPPIRPASPLQMPIRPRGVRPGSIGAIVGNFKSLAARRINNLRRTPGDNVWQRGYYDRIVRNERELNAIRRYIVDNPQRWAEDRDNLDRLTTRMRLVL